MTGSPNDLPDTGEKRIKDRPLTSPKNLELICNVSNVLMQSLDINEILEKVLSYIFDLLTRIDRGVILLIDDRQRKILEVISKGKGKKNTGRMYSRSIVNRVIKSEQAIMVSDTKKEEEFERSTSMELMNIRSVICVPLISKSKLRGVIYVDSVNKPYGFRKEDLSLLSALSGPAALAIENALLYSNLEKIVQDRTKTLMETEEKLKESETRFKAIFNSMLSGVMVLKAREDGEGFVILGINRAAAKIENVDGSDVLGKQVNEVFPHLEKVGLTEALKRVRETGRSERRSVALDRSDNKIQYLEYYVYLLHTKEIVVRFVDMTDKKKAQESQRVLQEQLLISQKMESIGSFAGGTAHNFRNILQAISGNIEYIEMLYGENPQVREIARSIYGSVEKGVGLINSLLHFSKRGGRYQMEIIDLNDVVKETHEIISRVFSKNIDITLDLEDALFVRGNGSLLGQALMNLFTNARDAMPNGGKMVVEGKKSRDKVFITVSDTGHGMDKETVEKIFDPFFTLKDVGTGTGLGLSTSLGIVEQHGGNINVFSKPGRGSRFEISLPSHDVEAGKKEPQKDVVIRGQGQKILIVDDEVLALGALSKLVTSLGYKAISVDDPAVALDAYEKSRPDVVLMDRNMPGMDGSTCTKEIISNHPEANIIMISGYDESGANGIDESVKNLIKGYIEKPCRIEELSKVLSQALG